MRLLTLPVLALALLFGFSSSAAAQVPYRLITNVFIVPDVSSGSTTFYMEVVDPVEGDGELWEVESQMTGDSADSNTVGTSLYINDQLSFNIDFLTSTEEITVETIEGMATVTRLTYNTDPEYLQLVLSTTNERLFVQGIMQELRTMGTAQGILPVMVLPEYSGLNEGSDSSESSDEDAAATVVNCRAECLRVLGRKPVDCDGAWDEYVCCVWELALDACIRKCECNQLPWWQQAVCWPAIVVANGLDATACILGLPIPGG